ncbi:MAG TPA: translation initiation factor IF-2, partial [Geobacterales bacterium]|nr:translation initiation factor IF-2 [Geobacterales bacterium]
MSKIRVYELAQKMGIENKELVTRLQGAGMDVKNHMASVDEEEIRKVLAPSKSAESSQEEVRVKPTLIRRRARVVEDALTEGGTEDVAAEPPVEVTPVEREVVVEQPVLEEKPLPVEVVAEVKEEPVVIKEEPVAVVEPPVEEKPKPAIREFTPSQQGPARILGRVELHRPQPKPRPEASRPSTPPRGAAQAPGQTQGQPRPSERPPRFTPPPAGGPAPLPVDDRKKGKKKEFAPATDAAKPGKKGVERKKEGERKDLMERRERIFEPGPKTGKGKKGRERDTGGRKTEITVPKAIKRIIKVADSITVGELAKRMGVKATDIIRALMKLGVMTTINHPLDVDTATILATDFGYEIENVTIDLDEVFVSTPDQPEDMERRPPVVTIMGHVDHGKTSLLDAIREANVMAGEAGGITQHIGAYDVELNGRKITFLDTPGHEAFTAMRARGAKVTDIVVLVVAADDGVMPQTREAVNHARAAGVPIIIAINKIDKPEAKPERVKQELMELGIVAEEWGGDAIFVEVSAKKRINLPALLEMILLQADVLDLKANPNKPARGTIVEAKLDRGRGPVATVLVQEGTVKVGDYFVAGTNYGRVRAMQNDRGEKLSAAGPAMPVEVIGFTGVPDSGDIFVSLADEKQAKEIAQQRQQKMRESELAKSSKLSLEQLYEKIQKGEVKDLNTVVKADVHGSVEAVAESLRKLSLEQLYEKIQKGEVKDLNTIVKGDVQGSVEAVAESLRKLTTDAIRLNVLHASVGAITETDVNLASASNAIILGFNVRPEVKAAALAEKEGVDVRLYNIIYDAVDDIKKAMEGLLEPTFKEKYLGRAEIREVFSVPKAGMVA